MRPKGNLNCRNGDERRTQARRPIKDNQLNGRKQCLLMPTRPKTFIINVLIMSLLMLVSVATLANANAQAALPSNYDGATVTSPAGFSPPTQALVYYRPPTYANYAEQGVGVGGSSRVPTDETGFMPTAMTAAGRHYAVAHGAPAIQHNATEQLLNAVRNGVGDETVRPAVKFDYEINASNYKTDGLANVWRTPQHDNDYRNYRLTTPLYQHYAKYLQQQGEQQKQRQQQEAVKPQPFQGITGTTLGYAMEFRKSNKPNSHGGQSNKRQSQQNVDSSEVNLQVTDSAGRPIQMQLSDLQRDNDSGYDQNVQFEIDNQTGQSQFGYTTNDPLQQLQQLQQQMQQQQQQYAQLQQQLSQQQQQDQPHQDLYDPQITATTAAAPSPMPPHNQLTDYVNFTPHQYPPQPASAPQLFTPSGPLSLPPITATIHHNAASASAAAGLPLGRHVHLTKHIPLPQYQQVAVPYNRTIPIQIPRPVITAIPRPYPIHVPVSKTVAVPQMQHLKIPLEKIKPYPVERPMPYIVERHVPYRVEKQVAAPFYYPYPIKVPIVKTVLHKIGGHQHLNGHSQFTGQSRLTMNRNHQNLDGMQHYLGNTLLG